MFLVRMMGPVIGFGMGTYFNKYYYKFDPPVGLTQVDPEWIGRWWAGFLIIGVILFLPSLALFFFPTPKPNPDGTPPALALVDRHIKKDSKGEAIIPKTLASKVKGWCLEGHIHISSHIMTQFRLFQHDKRSYERTDLCLGNDRENSRRLHI